MIMIATQEPGQFRFNVRRVWFGEGLNTQEHFGMSCHVASSILSTDLSQKVGQRTGSMGYCSRRVLTLRRTCITKNTLNFSTHSRVFLSLKRLGFPSLLPQTDMCGRSRVGLRKERNKRLYEFPLLGHSSVFVEKWFSVLHCQSMCHQCTCCTFVVRVIRPIRLK